MDQLKTVNGHELQPVRERYPASGREGEFLRCSRCGCAAYTTVWFEQHRCERVGVRE